MELKKGFRKTETGIIPDVWKVEILENLTDRIGDGIHTTPKYSDSGEFYFVNGNNLEKGRIKIIEDTKQVKTEDAIQHLRNLNCNSVLISINGTIGNVAYYENEKIILGKSAAYINPNEKLSKEYLYHYLQTGTVYKYFENELTGSTIKNLGLAAIRNTPVPLPPTKAEQTAIANALSDMDNLIAGLEKQIEKKKAIKQGAMQDLLRPKEGWVVKRLGELCEVYGRIGFRGYTVNDIVPEFQGPIALSPSNIVDGKLSLEKCTYISWFKYHESPEIKVFEGDILLVKTASIGKNCMVKRLPMEATVNPQIVVINKIKIDSKLLSYFIASPIIQDQINAKVVGGVLGTLSQVEIKNFQVEIPPTKVEQDQIGQILSDFDENIDAYVVRLEKIKQLKQGMMQELLTGKTRLV